MKRKVSWFKVILVVLFAASVGWRYFYGRNLGQEFPGEARKLLTAKSGGEAEITVTPAPAVETAKVMGEFSVVKRVIDGDTVELDNGEKVRYIGIDTPETLDPRKPIQCFGVEAAAKNKELVEGKRVRLEKDVTDRDKYNRLLRYIYVTGEAGPPSLDGFGEAREILVNLELVKQGFAHSYTYPPDVKYQDLFVAAEKEARESGRGLWNSCPVPKENIGLSPTGAQTLSVDSSCKIKGNIGATGEKIYHLPGCGSYEKTAIDESRGEKWFCSEDEAQGAGWRKAKNC